METVAKTETFLVWVSEWCWVYQMKQNKEKMISMRCKQYMNVIVILFVILMFNRNMYVMASLNSEYACKMDPAQKHHYLKPHQFSPSELRLTTYLLFQCRLFLWFIICLPHYNDQPLAPPLCSIKV